jgi:hypothetical protein
VACAGCGASALAGTEVSKSQALAELARMKRSLRGWLKARLKNDAIASGKIKTKPLPVVARERILSARDWAGEQRIANDVYSLLSHVHPDAKLPNPSVQSDSNAAVKLATIALKGLPETAAGPQAQGIIPLVVGGVVVLAIMSGTSAWADVQKEKEKRACIESGACTDYGFWLKWTGIAVVGIVVLLNKDKLIKALKFGK